MMNCEVGGDKMSKTQILLNFGLLNFELKNNCYLKQ